MATTRITDKDRAEQARDLLEKADKLLQELLDAGAAQLEDVRDGLRDAFDTLDELEFSDEGRLVAEEQYEEEEDEEGEEQEPFEGQDETEEEV